MFCHTYQSAPIAIYDSGIGGLAITRAIKAILPQESIHYIGDTKNLPYGDKTSTALCDYIIEVINFCLRSRYKLLVIACNTATAASDHFLSSYLNGMGAEMGIVNVIDPVATYIHAKSHYNQIALIGTTYTVASGIYTERLQKANLTLTTLATPLLVPMVEACFDGSKVDHRLLGDYLAQIALPNLDALIPACTHYLFLENAIKSFFSIRYQKTIEVTDVAKLTALAVKEWLTQRNLLNTTVKRLPDCFMATALTPAFTKASQKLFAQTPIAINLTAKRSLEIFHDIDTKHSAYI